MVLGVKIRNNEDGLFRLKDGRFSKNGKTYSTLGFAKSSITNDIGWCRINKVLLNCDFVIFNDDGTIQTIPVKTHMIDYFERYLKRKQKQKASYDEEGFATKHIDDCISKINCLLDYLRKEGIENE